MRSLLPAAFLIFLPMAAPAEEELETSWAVKPSLVGQLAARVKSAPSAWQSIPWSADLPQALELARKEHAPVFLFTFGGNFLQGRC
jgi:hypothetical protein